MGTTVRAVIAHRLHSDPGGAVHNDGRQEIRCGISIWIERDYRQTLETGVCARRLSKPDHRQILGADLELIIGIKGGDGQRKEAQARVFQALQEDKWQPGRVFNGQKMATVLERRQPGRKCNYSLLVVRDGSEILGFTLRHEGFGAAEPTPAAWAEARDCLPKQLLARAR